VEGGEWRGRGITVQSDDGRAVRAPSKAEILFWMLRIYDMGDIVFMAAAGFLLAAPRPNMTAFAAWMVAILAVSGAGVLVNDVADAPRDAVTAPGRPIVSGAVSRRSVAVLAFVLTAGATATFWVLGGGTWRSFAAIALAAASGAFLALYSLVFKSRGVGGSLCAALPLAAVCAMGFLLAGGEFGWPAGLVIVLAGVTGFVSNLYAALRDVSGDAEVGNRTVPVRIGSARTVDIIAALELLSLVGIGVWALTIGEAARYALIAVAIGLVNLGNVYRRVRRVLPPGGERPQRERGMYPMMWVSAWKDISLLIVLAPIVGGVMSAIFMVSLLALQRVYGRRSWAVGLDHF
jgi:4-hydroxybenzoate polyprenyltransferase